MKIRAGGFVSNSSSSSFILAVRRGHRVMELLDGVNPIVKKFAMPMVEFLSKQTLLPLGEAISDYFYGGGEDECAIILRETAKDLLGGEDEDDWLFCYSDAADGDRYEMGETMICYTSIDHDEGPVRLWSQGGY